MVRIRNERISHFKEIEKETLLKRYSVTNMDNFHDDFWPFYNQSSCKFETLHRRAQVFQG